MIFVIEDDPVLLSSVVQFLTHGGHDVEGFADAESALAAAVESPPDLVISDVHLPGMNGLELVEKLGEIDAGIVRIAVTAHASARSAVRAMRAGCYEYLEKPVDMGKLTRLLERALSEQRAQRELAWLRRSASADDPLTQIWGTSPAIEQVRQQLASFARLTAEAPPILILGETGVGKGLAARVLHALRFGDRAPFIELNCAALPDTLVEAELFGFEKSAFTDAKQAKPGLLEVASGGTVFLDEIGEFPLSAQAKLLTVLEARTVRRLGSVRERKFNAAIVAASNVNLRAAAGTGAFRPDLYHRLAALTVSIPPLRARSDDLLALARMFLVEAAGRYRKPLQALSSAAEALIRGYPWPGNVRELQFAMERAAILAPQDAQSLPADALAGLAAPIPPLMQPDVSADASGSTAVIDASSGAIRVVLPEDGVPFEELEKAILVAALERTGGNVSQAARLLDMNRDQVRYRVRKFKLG